MGIYCSVIGLDGIVMDVLHDGCDDIVADGDDVAERNIKR